MSDSIDLNEIERLAFEREMERVEDFRARAQSLRAQAEGLERDAVHGLSLRIGAVFRTRGLPIPPGKIHPVADGKAMRLEWEPAPAAEKEAKP